jgi:hypothetical protein
MTGTTVRRQGRLRSVASLLTEVGDDLAEGHTRDLASMETGFRPLDRCSVGDCTRAG